MLVKLDDGESVTVMLNHVDEPHAFTLSNRGGTLCGREFHRPAEQGELAATNSQHTQAKIVRGCKECSLYNECTDGENGSRKMVQECWSGDYLLFVPRTTSAVR